VSTRRSRSEATRITTYEKLEQQVRVALAANNLESVRARLAKEHPATIAAVLDRLDHPKRHLIFDPLPVELKAKVVDELSIQATREMLDDLPIAKIARLLDRLPMDEAAEVLAEDVPHRKKELLAAMRPKNAAEVRLLLQYPEHSAGRMMTEKFARLKPDMTAGEAIAYVRKVHSKVETLTDLYVLDPAGRLMGVVSLREVVVAPARRRINNLMNSDLVTVAPETDREEVARLVSHYDYLAIPVVLPGRKMLGVIPVDDVIDVLVAEGTEDILRFGGLEGGGVIDQPYFTIPLMAVIRRRVGWLLLLFVAETFTGTVLRSFEEELASVVALSFFIPLLIGTGGNTGAQTVSTLIRGLALREVRSRDLWRVIRRELLGGLLIGLILGGVAYGRALLWKSSPPLALTVGLAIVAICTWANAIGALVPLIAHRVRIDPAVVSAPLITTLVDATGLAIYLLIAKTVLGI